MEGGGANDAFRRMCMEALLAYFSVYFLRLRRTTSKDS
jgi:hypothetical protein